MLIQSNINPSWKKNTFHNMKHFISLAILDFKFKK